MFKRKEKQSLIEASRKALKNAEKEVKELTKENKALYEENKELRFENEEQSDLIKRIEKLATSNTYNNEKAVLNKIKELISDYQSQN